MKSLIIISLLALSLCACTTARDDRMAQGAAVGGVGGAVIGGVASRSVGGAVIGGVAGAAVGAVVADATRPQPQPERCYYSQRYGRTVCSMR